MHRSTVFICRAIHAIAFISSFIFGGMACSSDVISSVDAAQFIPQVFGGHHLKTKYIHPQGIGVVHVVERDGDNVIVASLCIGILSSSEQADVFFKRGIKDTSIGPQPVAGIGDEAVKWFGRVLFVRDNAIIDVSVDISKDQVDRLEKSKNQDFRASLANHLTTMAETMAKAIDSALLKGEHGVTRGEKVDSVIIDDVTWGDGKHECWKAKTHRASALGAPVSGTIEEDRELNRIYFASDDCVIAMKQFKPGELAALVNTAKERVAKEKAAAELPERKRKTEEALAVLKNVGSTEMDQAQAVRMLGETGFPSMIPVLLDEFRKTKSASVRLGAAHSLAEFKDRRALPDFLKVLENPPATGFDTKRVEDSREVGIRCAAARGLENIGDPEALPVLRKVLSREQEFQRVRQNAMHAVGRMKDRQSAAMILKVIATPPTGDINQKYIEDEEGYRKVAIRAISDIGGEEALPTLQKVADNELEYPRLRKYARENIGRIQYDAAEAKRDEEFKKNPPK